MVGVRTVDGRHESGKAETEMLPLYHDPHFTFRFANDRTIPRFHLEGVEAGRRVTVFRPDPVTGERLNIIASAITGAGGWVDLTEPILVRAGDGFVAVAPAPPAPRPLLGPSMSLKWPAVITAELWMVNRKGKGSDEWESSARNWRLASERPKSKLATYGGR